MRRTSPSSDAGAAGGNESGSRTSGVRRGVSAAALILLFFLIAACGREGQSPLRIGDSAPQFTLPDLDGKPVSLADYAGHPVVLRFILTDCKYCRADSPFFNRLHARYGTQGLGMLYIESLGVDTAVLESFVRELAVTFPVLRDSGGETAARYRVKALPQTVVLDPEHNIAGAILGGVSEQELQALLSPYLR